MTATRPVSDVATLLEALPYIREFHGQTVVIKYGGAAMNDPALREEFARDVVLLKYVGMNPVIVHGGGPEITSYMERLDLPVEFVDGLRVSDPATVEVAKMVLVGKVNKDIVLRLGRHGQPAVGLCGDDGLLFRVARQAAPSGRDIGFVGRIERVDVDVLEHIAQDYIPVVASVGADRDGNSYNINADEAAGAVARALGAYKIMFLTDVAGWLRDPADPATRRLGGERRRGPGGARVGRRRDAPQAGRVPGRDPRRGVVRPHRRRPGAALAAARAVHRRRPGHQDRGRAMTSTVRRWPSCRTLEREYAIPTYARNPVQFVRGAGCRLWDADGNEYLDFLAGISVLNVGHCHPRVVEAVREQVGPAHPRHQPVLHGAGDAAVGARCRAARWAARCFSATRAPRPTRRRSSWPAGRGRAARSWSCARRFTAAPTGRCRRPRRSPSRRRSRRWCRASRWWPSQPRRWPAAVDGDTAAVLLEPIQGETGIHVLSDELLSAARDACDDAGAALIFDEIQTGMGRTGTLWAYEQTGVVPDALTSAKALGGGLPIGALVTGPRLADVLQPGDHGSTFAGGPVVASAALVALEICSDPALLEQRAGARRAAAGRARRAAGRGRGARPRADGGRRLRRGRVGARGRAAGAARAAAGDQRDRPGHGPVRAAAGGVRGGDRRGAVATGSAAVHERRRLGQGLGVAGLRAAGRRGGGDGAAPAAGHHPRQHGGGAGRRGPRVPAPAADLGAALAHRPAPAGAGVPAPGAAGLPHRVQVAAASHRRGPRPRRVRRGVRVDARAGAGRDPPRSRSAATGPGPLAPGRPRGGGPRAAVTPGRRAAVGLGPTARGSAGALARGPAVGHRANRPGWPAGGSTAPTGGWSSSGGRINEASPAEEYHELRKKGKELRYLLELFGAPLYPSDVVDPLVKALKGLQDVLGRHQDREVQVALLRVAGRRGGDAAAWARRR